MKDNIPISKPFIGIITCFLDNCGACLQAFALQHTLKQLGYKNEIINYTEQQGYYKATYKDSNKFFLFFKKIKDRSFRNMFDMGLYKKPAFVRFRKKYLTLSKTEYKLTEQLFKSPLKYDCYICGSDQIWNPTFYGKCQPIHYLAFVGDDIPKIAYAPSIGLNDIPTEYISQFKNYIQRFNYISVREDKGAELISCYANRTAKHVLDPTLLLSNLEWSKYLLKTPKRKPYVFCYLFGNHDYYKDVINRIAKQNNLEIRMIPFFKSDIESNFITEVNAGPLEFLTLVKNADFILTDSFHGTVFSILFKKDFNVLLRDSDEDFKSMNSRIYSLLKLVGLQDRLLEKEEAKKIEISRITNYEAVHQIIEKMRIDSLLYLKNALEGK